MPRLFLTCLLLSFPFFSYAQMYEINGSPFATEGAPLPERMQTHGEKLILVNPGSHVFGAYGSNGKLIRWGIATAGADQCEGSEDSCRTHTGQFRIYSAGDGSCNSSKYDGAPMPYCMFFNGGQALHGSSGVQFSNISHGCIRLHLDDAKWLRYHFVEVPNAGNQYQGTRVIVQPYETSPWAFLMNPRYQSKSFCHRNSMSKALADSGAVTGFLQLYLLSLNYHH